MSGVCVTRRLQLYCVDCIIRLPLFYGFGIGHPQLTEDTTFDRTCTDNGFGLKIFDFMF